MWEGPSFTLSNCCCGNPTQEGLRLYPPGAVAVREATETLELRGFVIPRGSWIHVSAACFVTCLLAYITPSRSVSDWVIT